MNSLQRFLRHIRFLCQKELLATLKDRRMRVIIVVPVIMQGLLFGYAANYNLEQVPYAAVDLSHTALSQAFLAQLDGTATFKRVQTLDNPQGIGTLIDEERILLAIVIPDDFATKLTKGEIAPIETITDGRNASVASLAAGYVSRIANRWNAAQTGAPVTVQNRTWYNPNQETRWNFLPSLIAMISFVQVIMLSGLSIAREREQGTFDQLLVTPLSPCEILVGKAVVPVLVGFLQSSLLFCISLFWFEVPFAGSLGTLALVLFLFMLSATGIGLSLSSIAENMQQVLVYVFVTLLPLVLLSGVATPVRNMPEFLQFLTYADPMRFAVTTVRRVYLEGATVVAIWQELVPLLAVAAVTLPLAAWLFRHKTT